MTCPTGATTISATTTGPRTGHRRRRARACARCAIPSPRRTRRSRRAAGPSAARSDDTWSGASRSRRRGLVGGSDRRARDRRTARRRCPAPALDRAAHRRGPAVARRTTPSDDLDSWSALTGSRRGSAPTTPTGPKTTSRASSRKDDSTRVGALDDDDDVGAEPAPPRAGEAGAARKDRASTRHPASLRRRARPTRTAPTRIAATSTRGEQHGGGYGAEQYEDQYADRYGEYHEEQPAAAGRRHQPRRSPR